MPVKEASSPVLKEFAVIHEFTLAFQKPLISFPKVLKDLFTHQPTNVVEEH